MILAWFRKKLQPDPPPPPMAITPGAEYVMEVGNPFMPDPRVRVEAVQGGWVRYRFLDGAGHPQHTQEGYFRHCYKRCGGDGDR